jgi:hypothetical protein
MLGRLGWDSRFAEGFARIWWFVLQGALVFARVQPGGWPVRRCASQQDETGGTVKDLMGVGGALWSPSQARSDRYLVAHFGVHQEGGLPQRRWSRLSAWGEGSRPTAELVYLVGEEGQESIGLTVW